MKKRLLLLSGVLLLLSTGSFAQQLVWQENFESGNVKAYDEEAPESYVNEDLQGFEFYALSKSRNDRDNAYDSSDPYDPDTIPTVFLDTIIPLHNAIDEAYVRSKGKTPADTYSNPAIDMDIDVPQFQKLGVSNPDENKYFFRYTSGGGTSSESQAYQANFFVRGLPIKPHTSYRVSFYMRVDTVTARLDLRLMRGWHQSEKEFAMDNKGSKTFTFDFRAKNWVVKVNNSYNDSTELKANVNKWQRYTYMTYYNDSAFMNQYCQYSYSSWWKWDGTSSDGRPYREKYMWYDMFKSLMYKMSDDQLKLFIKSWTDTHDVVVGQDENGDDIIQTQEYTRVDTFSSKIVQPNTFFLRFAFRGPGANYDIDYLSLYESTIGGAEYSQGVIRLDFGYDTNIPELCSTSDIGRLAVPAEAFVVTAYNSNKGARIEIPMTAIEYQSDGMVYMWTDEDLYDSNISDLKISFNNPDASTGAQVCYSGDLYPNFDNVEWVNAGKVVPNFADEPLVSADFEYIPNMDELAPSLVSAEPENKSFGFDDTQRTFVLNMTKMAYVGSDKANSMICQIYGGNGDAAIAEESNIRIQLLTEEPSQVLTFTIPSEVAPKLDGTYKFEITNIHAYNPETGETSEYDETAVPNSEIIVEFSWGEPSTDNSTTSGQCFYTLNEAYQDCLEFITKDAAGVDCTALDDFKALVDSYEPYAFLKIHHAPSEYPVAAEVLEKALENIEPIIETVQNFSTIVASAKATLEGASAYSLSNKYNSLKAAIDKADAINIRTATSDVLIASSYDLQAMSNALLAIPALTAQTKALYDLNVALGNTVGDVLIDGATVSGMFAKIEDDDAKLVELLKLEALKAIYSNLAAGKDIKNVDVTGFIVNPNLYMCGVLDDSENKDDPTREIFYESTNSSSVPKANKIKKEMDCVTVYPGWVIKVIKMDSKYGVRPTGKDGGTNHKAGEVMPGEIYCDWATSFTMTQTITDLPAGSYTLTCNAAVDEPDFTSSHLGKLDTKDPSVFQADDQSTSKTFKEDQAVPDTVTVPEFKGGDMAISYHHGKQKYAHVTLSQYKMSLSIAYNPADATTYAAKVSELEGKIQDVKTRVAPMAAPTAVEYYNLNGMKVLSPKAGDIVIRKTNGISETIMF